VLSICHSVEDSSVKMIYEEIAKWNYKELHLDFFPIEIWTDAKFVKTNTMILRSIETQSKLTGTRRPGTCVLFCSRRTDYRAA
jgi:hypothetical protein